MIRTFLGVLLLVGLGSSYDDKEFGEMVYKMQSIADHYVRPQYGGPKEPIQIQFDVERITLNDTSGTLVVDLYAVQTWTDTRLLKLELKEPLILSEEEKIWSPKLFFLNGRVLDEDSHSRHSIRILPSGKITKRSRYLVLATCNMYMRFFPMDQQTCNLLIQGSIILPEELAYHLNQSSVHVRIVEPVEFNLVNTSVQIKKNPFPIEGYEIESEILSLEFKLNRNPFHYFLNYYVPGMLMVAFSWLSFWSTSPSNCVGVSLISLIGLTYLTYMLNWHSMYIHSFRALDLFTFVSGAFILLSLWEVVSLRINRRKVDLTKKLDGDYISPKKKMFGTAILTDSRKIFPGIYVGFVLLYWSTLSINRKMAT